MRPAPGAVLIELYATGIVPSILVGQVGTLTAFTVSHGHMDAIPSLLRHECPPSDRSFGTILTLQ